MLCFCYYSVVVKSLVHMTFHVNAGRIISYKNVWVKRWMQMGLYFALEPAGYEVVPIFSAKYVSDCSVFVTLIDKKWFPNVSTYISLSVREVEFFHMCTCYL